MQIIEHPPIVQEGLDVINALTNEQSLPKEIPEASLPVQEGDEAVQLPYTESGDILVLMETVDPSLNKEAVLVEEFPTAVNSEVTILESPVQSSEVQGNGIFSRVFLFTPNLLATLCFLCCIFLFYGL